MKRIKYDIMKKLVFLSFIISLLLLVSCTFPNLGGKNEIINATEHGLSAENFGEDNSKALQSIIDEAALTGKTVYIPAGEYEFAENGKQTIGSHCIKMRSGVSIVGDGEKTVLKPVGRSRYGLDMFYFNDYIDTGDTVYLENCRFESFVIDAAGTSCDVYTSAGKGFMFNLFKNCHFKNVTVKNTDATGFGVDCPIDSTISDCVAIGCGKAATSESSGASGFGIGFGFSENESISISDCTAVGNKKFGFFFEHQGRFNIKKYNAVPKETFKIANCFAEENLYGFGGINTFGTVYENCVSKNSLLYGFFFEDSFASGANGCKSTGEKRACFAAAQNLTADDISLKISGIHFYLCEGESTPVGVLALGKENSPVPTADKCIFRGVEQEYAKKES